MASGILKTVKSKYLSLFVMIMKKLENLKATSLIKVNNPGMVKGGTETRKTIWTKHGDHEDNDGYNKDWHAFLM